MIVKPTAGMKIRDPITKAFIDPKGQAIGEPNRYWINRLRDKDVYEVDEIDPEDPSDIALEGAETSSTDDA